MAVQEFLQKHEHDDVSTLILKYGNVDGVQMSVIANQIDGRRKAREKIPLYYNTRGVIYPPGINMEQCSSEATARFKATIVHKLISDRQSFIDLSGGFGVDTLFIGYEFKEGAMVEPDEILLDISAHNHSLVGIRHINYENIKAEEFFNKGAKNYSLFYIDPSRRSRSHRKVYSLKDCIPDVTVLLDKIFQQSKYLLLKASPLLDITQGLTEIPFTSNVYIVSVNNECKELLFFAQKGFSGVVTITASNIAREDTSYSFTVTDEQEATASFSDPLRYIYEPNAALLKAGAFKLIGLWFNLHKLAPSTHLYTSEELVRNFPGRTFEIRAFVKPRAKLLKQYYPDGKANITVRNYPMSVHDLKIATGLQDGGDKFLIGFSGQTKKFLAVAEKLS